LEDAAVAIGLRLPSKSPLAGQMKQALVTIS
jgi:hypothetical protein